MSPSSKPGIFSGRRRLWILGVIILAVGALWLGRRGGRPTVAATTFEARRGPLDITVVEGGSIQAQESQEIKCEVRVGYQGIKVLKIVEEGYLVTEDDVKQKKVLVELDSSDIRKNITQQDITFESTVANYVEAQQAYDIQKNQNLSDVKAAEQKLRFARLDLDKFLGAEATQQLLSELGIDPDLILSQTNVAPVTLPEPPTAERETPGAAIVAVASETVPASAPTGEVMAKPGQLVAAPMPSPSKPDPAAAPATATNSDAGDRLMNLKVDFARYADETKLGNGEAKQKFRKFTDDLQTAQKEMQQAKSALEATQRLHSKDFVSKTELVNDELKYDNTRLKVQTAETAQELFRRYDFAKSAEETFSKYVESVRELDRARKAAVAKLAQAEARMKSAQGRYNLEAKQRKQLQDELEKCTIRAEKQGLVVYGGGEEMYWRGEEQIREGATVRERQSIITIPDMTKMSLKVKIHETYIKKVKKGQKVRITVDAFADKVLNGEVTKVGVLPDSQNRWMNPDLKVYLTTISVEGTHDWLKPGMTAKAEIFVSQLTNVVYVPIQAVTPIEGKQYVYVVQNGRQEQQEVEVGEFSDEFIEVRKGVEAGQRVALKGPARRETELGQKGDSKKDASGGSDAEQTSGSSQPVVPAKS